MTFHALISLFLCLIGGTLATKNTSACSGTPNLLEIITDEPTLEKEVTNGKLFTIDGNGAISPALSIAHMWGTRM